MSAIDFFISVLKWAKSLDVFNSLVAKLEAIMSQVMGDHHLGKHDVRVVVIGGDLPVRLSRRRGDLGRLSGSRRSAGGRGGGVGVA